MTVVTDEPTLALMRLAIEAVRPYVKEMRERGWDATAQVHQCEVTETPPAFYVSLQIALPRIPVPIEMTSQSDDQEDTTMSAAIDAEGVTEKAAHLRDHGWFLDASDPTCWRHPRLPALPPISLTAAIELQREASIDEAACAHVGIGNPAGPRRIH